MAYLILTPFNPTGPNSLEKEKQLSYNFFDNCLDEVMKGLPNVYTWKKVNKHFSLLRNVVKIRRFFMAHI